MLIVGGGGFDGVRREPDFLRLPRELIRSETKQYT